MLDKEENFLYNIVIKSFGGKKMADGFTSYEGNAVLWAVHHNQGITHVYATSEAIALQRFMAKYPNRTVRKVVRA